MKKIILIFILRNKKRLMWFLFYNIVLILIFNLILSVYNNINYKIKNCIENRLENRTIVAKSDILNDDAYLNIFSNSEKIEKKFYYFEPITLRNTEFGHVILKQDIFDNIDIKNGRKPAMDNEIVIPDVVIMNNYLLNIENMLDKYIEFFIKKGNKEEKYKFKVVGIYNNQDQSRISNFYVSDNSLLLNIEDNSKIIIIGKNSNIVEKILKKADKKYSLELLDSSFQREKKNYSIIKEFFWFFILSFMVIQIIIYFLIDIKNVVVQEYYIIMMRINGLSNLSIINKIFVYFAVINNIIYLLSIILCVFIKLLLRSALKTNFIIYYIDNLYLIIGLNLLLIISLSFKLKENIIKNIK